MTLAETVKAIDPTTGWADDVNDVAKDMNVDIGYGDQDRFYGVELQVWYCTDS